MENKRSNKHKEIIFSDMNNPRSPHSQDSADHTKCALPHLEGESHLEFCEIVACGHLMREEQESMFQSVPDICNMNARDVVKYMLGSNCEDFVLTGACDNKLCTCLHSGMLQLNPPWCDSALSFKIFTKWFLHNSSQPNFKILLHLLSSIGCIMSPELHLLILSFSRLFSKIRINLRKPLGLLLIEKLVNTVNLDKSEAIRLVLVFLVEPQSDKDQIMEILTCLGIFDSEMCQLYHSVSCIWHINDVFTFPKSVQFHFMRDCITSVPADIKFTRYKIVVEALKMSRKDTIREYTLIDKFMRTFFPQNCIVTDQAKKIILYGSNHRTVIANSTNYYKSSEVKNSSTVNFEWSYWDVKEAQRHGFKLVVGQNESKPFNETNNTFSKMKLVQVADNLEKSPEEIMAQMFNKGYPTDPTQETKDVMAQIEFMFNERMYENVASLLQAMHQKGASNECSTLVSNLMLTLHPKEIPNVVYDIMSSHVMGSSLRKSFIEMVNSLSVTFYQKRDYISGIKLLKTLRVCRENPFEFAPKQLNKQLFLIICSDIHYETRCYSEAVQILHYGNCFKLLNRREKRGKSFEHLERVVIKFVKGFVAGKMSTYALEIFRSTVLAQNDLFEPVNVARFYETVLCNTFLADSKAPCNTHDGANLYILVDKLCGNIKFRSVTYRSMLCSLVEAKASESVVRRTLRMCIQTGAYRLFKSTCLEIGSHFALLEMNVYIRQYFQYFVAQDEGKSLLLDTLPFLIYKESSPLSTTIPTHSLIENVNDELCEAVERFKLAIRDVSGQVEVPIEFTTPSQGTFSTAGIIALINMRP